MIRTALIGIVTAGLLAPHLAMAQAAIAAAAPAQTPSAAPTPSGWSPHAAPSRLNAARAQSATKNSIENIEILQQNGATIVRMSFAKPLDAAPQGFSVAQPARIAFDLPGVSNDTGSSKREVAQGDLRSVSLLAVDGKMRVVLGLRAMVPHSTAIDGNALLITLSPPRAVNASGAAAGAGAFALTAVDFRRGPQGEGRIVVDLSDANTGVDIRQQGKGLVVEFKRTALPESLRRRLNVADFGTPVQTVSIVQAGENVRMHIEPSGLWEHNAYQAETRFVLEVKAVAFDPNKLVQGARQGYQGEKLSFNFQNVEVRNLLNVIADFTKLNVVAADSVGGSLTIRLQDVPWDQALDIIMQTRGLDMRKNGNVVWIAPRSEISKQEKEELESRALLMDLEPLRIETFQLNYQRADDIARLLSNQAQRVLTKRGSAVVHQGTNQVFVQDTSTGIEEARRIIAKVDIPVRQVQIEARIVEATDKFSRSIGARLGFLNTTPGPFLGMRQVVGAGLSSSSYYSGLNPVAPAFNNGLNVNLPAAGVESGAQNSALSMVLLNTAGSKFLNLELTALEAEGQGKIISSPRVVTADQKEAVVEQGTELPYQSAAASGATSVAFKKANLALRVTPQITPDGNIIMAVDINKDSPGQQTTGGIAIDTKHVLTNVMVENGGTVVIGGIYIQDEREDISKLPVLGDLPYVGALFRNRIKRDSKSELLVFLTPRIIDGRLAQSN